MKPIAEVITESCAVGHRLLAETPGLTSVSFEFTNYTPSEVRAAAAACGSVCEYGNYSRRLGFCHAPEPGIYVHIYSTQVKMVEAPLEELQPTH